MHNHLLYQIALTLVPGIGPVRAKNLVAYCGSAEAIFKEKPQVLLKIPAIGKSAAAAFTQTDALKQAEQEIKFIEENHIIPAFFTEKNYPDRLRMCDDSPALIFTKGKMNLHTKRIISIVGTRTATSYGKAFCQEFLENIAPLKPLVVSGLAYGIDICAHRHALAQNLQTIACVAHGLDKVYPALHIPVANEMLNNGGLVSEFVSNTRMTPDLFPMRNRIIAGLADCTIVVETDMKGGSMITAHLAHSYSREVFAVPGRYNDRNCTGCNSLIKKNIAAIITSAEDLASYMNWDIHAPNKSKQLPLFSDLTNDETAVIQLLSSNGKSTIDQLSISSGLIFSKLSSTLLELEFRGIVKTLPGKMYELI